MSQITFGAVVW